MMFNVYRLNVACGNKFDVQGRQECIRLAFHCVSMGVCQDMKICSMYVGVQCPQVFNLAGSTALFNLNITCTKCSEAQADILQLSV